MTFWKFRLTRHPKPHLSIEAKGQSGSGNLALCGLKITKILGSARTITRLEGDECVRCGELFTRSSTSPSQHAARLSDVSVQASAKSR